MKKVVRTVWISLLSGLAFLVACTGTKGISRTEKKQLKAERTSLINELDNIHRNAADITNPEALLAAKQNEFSIICQLNDIDNRLGNKDDQAKSSEQLGTVATQIDSLKQVIKANKDGEGDITPCVYGPPGGNLNVMKEQHRIELMEQLGELTSRFNELQSALKRREGACVYGSPEVMERYKKETNRLRHEADSINQEIQNVENELNTLMDNE